MDFAFAFAFTKTGINQKGKAETDEIGFILFSSPALGVYIRYIMKEKGKCEVVGAFFRC